MIIENNIPPFSSALSNTIESLIDDYVISQSAQPIPTAKIRMAITAEVTSDLKAGVSEAQIINQLNILIHTNLNRQTGIYKQT